MKHYPAHKGFEAPVCEHVDCESVMVITEVVFSHRLTLCEYHGRDIEDLLREGYDSFHEWAQEFLKPKARRRWGMRRVISE